VTRYELDPEILADQHRRARYGGADRGVPDDYPPGRARPPAIVAGWACRAGCGRFVPVDDAAVAARDSANGQLRRRGEPELGVHEIMFCPACKHRAAPDRADALRRRVDETAKLIAELKTLVDNDLRERSLVARLRDLGHPDVDGLRKAIAESRAAKNPTQKRRTT
jgi:hypothetical protein